MQQRPVVSDTWTFLACKWYLPTVKSYLPLRVRLTCHWHITSQKNQNSEKHIFEKQLQITAKCMRKRPFLLNAHLSRLPLGNAQRKEQWNSVPRTLGWMDGWIAREVSLSRDSRQGLSLLSSFAFQQSDPIPRCHCHHQHPMTIGTPLQLSPRLVWPC
jgi:hypothetical protein